LALADRFADVVVVGEREAVDVTAISGRARRWVICPDGADETLREMAARAAASCPWMLRLVAGETWSDALRGRLLALIDEAGPAAEAVFLATPSGCQPRLIHASVPVGQGEALTADPTYAIVVVPTLGEVDSACTVERASER
jgi:hypothetical protein